MGSTLGLGGDWPQALAWDLGKSEQLLAKFDGLAVFDENLGNLAAHFGLDLVHDFHRFDDANDAVVLNGIADLSESGAFGGGSRVEGAHHW